jgi:uncharacterized membrane protein
MKLSSWLICTLKAGLPNWLGTSKLDRGLSISLAVAIVAALGCLGYFVATPNQSEKFTEFYILGTEGKAEGYPKQVILGDPVDIVVGVVNHEYQPASYLVKIAIDGIEKTKVTVGTLAHEEEWEERVSFIPQVVGERQRVDFCLYKNGEDEPYLDNPLHLYIDVISP